MHVIALGKSDEAPLETFPLRWRWTQESHAVFSAAELDALTPLAPEAALRVSRIARRLHGTDGLDRGAFEAIVEHQVTSDESAGAWLAELPISPGDRVLVSWDAATALTAPWSVFVRRWDDFCYPSSDDVTILPLGGGWALAYLHYEVLQWGRTRAV